MSAGVVLRRRLSKIAVDTALLVAKRSADQKCLYWVPRRDIGRYSYLPDVQQRPDGRGTAVKCSGCELVDCPVVTVGGGRWPVADRWGPVIHA